VDRARCFVKWLPSSHAAELHDEPRRLDWAARFTSVPTVIGDGRDDDGAWLVTSPVPGENAVSPRWKHDPATAARAIGEGLRALHDTLPVAGCPFSWSAANRVADTRRRAAVGRLDPSAWDPIHQRLSIEEAVAAAAETRPEDRLVVCQGDPCAPNTILTSDGYYRLPGRR